MKESEYHIYLSDHKVYKDMRVHMNSVVKRYRYDDRDDWLISENSNVSLNINLRLNVDKWGDRWLYLNTEDSIDFINAHPCVEEAIIRTAKEVYGE